MAESAVADHFPNHDRRRKDHDADSTLQGWIRARQSTYSGPWKTPRAWWDRYGFPPCRL